MAPHSSTLAWKIPWTEEHGRLQSMGSRRVGHDWVTSLSLFTFMHWRRKWQPTPVFLPGESQGWGSLVGFRLWGRRVGHDWSDLAAAAAAALISKWRAGNQRSGMISFMVRMGNGNSSSFFTLEYFCFFGFRLKTKPLKSKTQQIFFPSTYLPSYLSIRSVVSDFLWPHGLQHARTPCPSLSPRVCSNSCALSWWCHPPISSSAAPCSFCLQFHTYHSELPLLTNNILLG